MRFSNVEVHIVDHCNLRCRACNHASPNLRPAFEDADSVLTSVRRLAALGVNAGVVRVLGGEPLLHPNLVTILRGIRSIGIAPSIHVVTNGKLLPRMPAEFWRAVDEVAYSVYPEVEVSWPPEYEAKVRRKYFPVFRETFSTHRNEDAQSVQRIWDVCRVRYCRGIVHGRFYKCMRAPYIGTTLGTGTEVEDGLDLATATTADLEMYIACQTPLKACWNCAGTSGKSFPHEQARLEEWRALQARPLEEMLEPNRG